MATPFGTAEAGALDALKGPIPSRDELSDEKVGQYLVIVLKALQDKVADRDMKQTQSRNRTNTDLAYLNLIEQGLRLLVLERIMLTRHLVVPREAQEWVRTLRMTPPIARFLNHGGVPAQAPGTCDSM